jgi:hypothetical protein
MIASLARMMRALGPYAAVELILPGGSLIALSLWALRHRAWLKASARRAVALTPVLSRLRLAAVRR